MTTRTTLLKIDSSIQGSNSVSKALTSYLANKLKAQNSELLETHHDLGEHPLPEFSAKELVIVHGSQETDDPEAQQKLAKSNALINELMETDSIVIGAAMYNFGVSSSLKSWVDHIARARVTFRYTENGPEGLTGIENAYIVVSTGGTPVGSDYDFVSGYLKLIMSFIGVKNIHIIDASGKGSPEATIDAAKLEIDKLFS